MKRSWLLWFGPGASALLLVGLAVLGALTPSYNQIQQTVSEIGEAGAPLQSPFMGLLLAVALCLLLFAIAVWQSAGMRGFAGAALIAAMAISVAGVGVFAFPHPLHNVFGQSELIGYLAPLAVALAWRGRISVISWIAFALLWTSIALNLAYLGVLGEAAGGALQSLEPVYGLVQRSLFVIWFGWCAVFGVMLRWAA